ncbi:dienelactone hydrolase family protein [Salinibacterium sp. SYSU T00001]|uniref:dienelactone hydrolase family protein n=1 Tax=Homoserinimonas sedimenticola TaxID=2986805 RepID=UPI002235E03A|nr:dienelactone hydrolase family protein [Salinibacterium sedimenticola]MCW4384947.1 dienelactone hydrolase family protein [Salinibacterium sedimenticola]
MVEQAPHQNVTFPSGEREAYGYLAVPESGSGPGIILIQEWWGLVDHIKDVADRFAAEGFVVLAPDLYGGRVAHDGEEAAEMMAALPEAEAATMLAGALDYLLGLDAVTSRTVGAIGFCMGGGFVLALAAQQGERVSAAVPFYGVGQGVPSSYAGVRAAIQGHYGKNDTLYSVDKAKEQEQQIREESGADVEFFYYDAAHAFANDENPAGNYNADAAALALSRATEFLRRHVA